LEAACEDFFSDSGATLLAATLVEAGLEGFFCVLVAALAAVRLGRRFASAEAVLQYGIGFGSANLFRFAALEACVQDFVCMSLADLRAFGRLTLLQAAFEEFVSFQAALFWGAAVGYACFEVSCGLLAASGAAIIGRRRLAATEAVFHDFLEPRATLLFGAAGLAACGKGTLGLVAAILFAIRAFAVLQTVGKGSVGLVSAILLGTAVLTTSGEDLIGVPCAAGFAFVRRRRYFASGQTILQSLSEFGLAVFFAASVCNALLSDLTGSALAKLRAIGRGRRFFASDQTIFQDLL